MIIFLLLNIYISIQLKKQKVPFCIYTYYVSTVFKKKNLYE